MTFIVTGSKCQLSLVIFSERNGKFCVLWWCTVWTCS